MRRTVLALAVGALAALAVVLAFSFGGGSPRPRLLDANLTAVSGRGIAAQPTWAAPATLGPPDALPLSDGWRYRADPHNIGLAQNWAQGPADQAAWTPVTVPNDFNPNVSPASDRGMVGWYGLRFLAPPAWAGGSWSVSFQQVRRNAEVWLNGRQLGTNSDPYAPFSLRATSLRPGAQNLLVVRVDNFRTPDTFPEDWWNWGGIVGPVSLQPSARLSLIGLGVMPELGCSNRCGELLVDGTLHNGQPTAARPVIVVRGVAPDGTVFTVRHQVSRLAPGASMPVSFRVPVAGPPQLWSPQSPALYQVQVATTTGGSVQQLDRLRVGMRSVQVRGGILDLNGKRLWLHGAAIHQDMPGRGAALTDGDIDTIVSELRSVGANITRTHYLLDQRLLDALDAAGIMVWMQPPVDHADQELASPGGRAQALAMLRATILGSRSHPAVIVDSVGNELSPTPDTTPGTRAYLQQAIGLARTLDPAALAALDTYCYPGYPAQRIYSQLDVLGISSYFGWYAGPASHSIAQFSGLAPFLRQARAQYPDQALVVSEFGAEALYDGPPSTKGSYEFQTQYLQKTVDVVDSLPFMNGAIYWTLREFAEGPGWVGGADLPPGTTPDELHHKGLIAYDGTPKPAFALAEQLLASSPSYAH